MRHPNRLRQRRQYQRRVSDGRQRDVGNLARLSLGQLLILLQVTRQLDRQPRLADAARAGQRHQSHIGAQQQLARGG
jgi:hypothetical protein